MIKFIGTKQVNAQPMTRGDYNVLRGWKLPGNEDGGDAGYLVEYVDGGKPNTENFDGYVSWSPKEQFENAYQTSGSLSFGHAIELLKKGNKVARTGWNGKGVWLGLVEDTYAINFVNTDNDELESYENQRYIVMKTVDEKIVPWLASQTDVLANDWCEVG